MHWRSSAVRFRRILKPHGNRGDDDAKGSTNRRDPESHPPGAPHGDHPARWGRPARRGRPRAGRRERRHRGERDRRPRRGARPPREGARHRPPHRLHRLHRGRRLPHLQPTAEHLRRLRRRGGVRVADRDRRGAGGRDDHRRHRADGPRGGTRGGRGGAGGERAAQLRRRGRGRPRGRDRRLRHPLSAPPRPRHHAAGLLRLPRPRRLPPPGTAQRARLAAGRRPDVRHRRPRRQHGPRRAAGHPRPGVGGGEGADHPVPDLPLRTRVRNPATSSSTPSSATRRRCPRRSTSSTS